MNFLFYKASEFTAGTNQHFFNWVPGGTEGSFYASKATGEWGDHSFPFSAKVKNEWIYTFTSPYTVSTRTGTALLNLSLFAACNSLNYTYTQIISAFFPKQQQLSCLRWVRKRRAVECSWQDCEDCRRSAMSSCLMYEPDLLISLRWTADRRAFNFTTSTIVK